MVYKLRSPPWELNTGNSSVTAFRLFSLFVKFSQARFHGFKMLFIDYMTYETRKTLLHPNLFYILKTYWYGFLAIEFYIYIEIKHVRAPNSSQNSHWCLPSQSIQNFFPSKIELLITRLITRLISQPSPAPKTANSAKLNNIHSHQFHENAKLSHSHSPIPRNAQQLSAFETLLLLVVVSLLEHPPPAAPPHVGHEATA